MNNTALEDCRNYSKEECRDRPVVTAVGPEGLKESYSTATLPKVREIDRQQEYKLS